ncbi:DUF4241 domain-containing protein [Streptomyces sp. CAU 1734]|uniref:DUF4241 domain-containing protein n=1 Tax=Streptomyces sp. CAU 1734 TaxID=3140360 RepID=UPI003260E210
MAAGHNGVVEVRYCEGWDPGARAAIAPLAEAEARRRDASGEPYAVLLSSGGAPRALFQVDWGRAFLSYFLFDERARRTSRYEYRQLEPGRLHLRCYRQWHQTSPTEPEFPERGRRFTLTVHPGGGARRELEAAGSLRMGAEVPAEHRTVAKAGFGAWTAYLDPRVLRPDAADGPVTPVPAPDPAPEERAGPAPESGWSAPVPLRPRHLEALFTPGSRFTSSRDKTAVITEPVPAGLLRLPTGSVTAVDPGTADDRDQPFTVTVEPGEYPVLIASMRWEGEEWEGETPAAMLRIRDRPTATWELALRQGQDARLLDDGEFFGFGVDTGTGCFVDAAGRDGLAKRCEEWMTNHGFRGTDGEEAAYTEIPDPGSGAHAIAYLSGMGDGSYPVWIGRDGEGEVTCFVADMLVLHHAEPQPPVVEPAAFRPPPVPAWADDRREAPFTDPRATAEFIAAQLADVADFMAERRGGGG